MSPTSDSGRRDALLAAKLKALVRSRWGDVVESARPAAILGGSTLRAGARAWVLAEDEPGRRLGGALAWALTGDVEDLSVLATGDEGLLARRAEQFRLAPTIWRIDGSSLAATPAVPVPLPPEPRLDPRAAPFREVFEHAGAEAVVEHGVLRAEVRGLEVARVEIDADGARLAVGVGKHDREAHRELGRLQGDEAGVDRLFDAVRAVAEHRHERGSGHPAYHLAGERWLRSVVVRRPDLVGAGRLEPVSPPVERADLREAAAAPASGVDADGTPVLVVCSVGVDPDLVPAAVDAWLRDRRRPRLVLVVPEGDDYPALRRVADNLVFPAHIVTAPRGWRSL